MNAGADWADWAVAWLNAGTPWLASPALQRWAVPLAWAWALGALGWGVLARWQQRGGGWQSGGGWPVRAGCAAALALWALWPGPASPSWWLGLAFQAPSGTALVGLALWAAAPGKAASQGFCIAIKIIAAYAVLAGAALLFDAYFAGGSGRLYGWGFGPAAWTLAGLGLAGLWVGWGDAAQVRTICAALAALLLLGAITRWPSGNVWDVLIDPWLALAAALWWLGQGWRQLRSALA